ncbi:hypothetical protein J4416_00445 [Candidatus Pacearchaeota archaeon]|nr:hypothetical protein [Candidatus Pacearchaeota archaeon]HLC73380.1 hypothetical protein [Candidatus Nanoarchaeia archaeon]
MIKGYNKYEELAEYLHGFYTLQTLADRLKVSRTKAIYVIHRLRKLGFVKTTYGAGNKRLYNISLRNKQKGISYTEVINNSAPSPGLKLTESTEPYYIHDRKPSNEETLIYAIKQRDVRFIIASLVLFRKINNWSLLYNLAKKENLVCEICVLYEVARKIVRKVKRMPKRFINLAKNNIGNKFIYIINGISSDDFKNVEKKWKVYVPLNYSDLAEYSI